MWPFKSQMKSFEKHDVTIKRYYLFLCIISLLFPIKHKQYKDYGEQIFVAYIFMKTFVSQIKDGKECNCLKFIM